jgi:hypothetical protein
MVFRICLGATNAKKIYKGIACKTDLRGNNFPTMLRVWKVQKESFISILARRSSQETFLTTFSRSNTPKYLDERELSLKPKILKMLNWIEIKVLKKKICDLS